MIASALHLLIQIADGLRVDLQVASVVGLLVALLAVIGKQNAGCWELAHDASPWK